MGTNTPFAIVSVCILVFASASDTPDKGQTCSKFDRCKADDLFRTCSCETDCYKFGICCKDADSFPLMSPNQDEYLCQGDRTPTPVFALRKCLDVFRAHIDHSEMCTQGDIDRADVLGNVLVTSKKTRITYWNMDCAICNDEDPDNLLHWTVQVTCPAFHGQASFNQRFIENNLVFNQDIAEWGLNVSDGFVICHLNFHQPSKMAGLLKYCAPNMVASCPPDFEDKDVMKKCKKYHAERKMKNTEIYFRNPYCALCNGVEEDDLSCVRRSYSLFVDRNAVGGKVKVVFDSGEWLDRDVHVCSRNNSWDPFKKRCRKIPDWVWKSMMEAVTPVPINVAQRTMTIPCVTIFIFIFDFIINKKIFC